MTLSDKKLILEAVVRASERARIKDEMSGRYLRFLDADLFITELRKEMEKI